MTVTNHFELRWVDGYGAASDAPSELAVLIEELADKLPRSLDRIELAVRDVRLPDGSEARIGVLQLDVVVPSEQRPVAFLHAAVLPPGHRLDAEGWSALVARRYGPYPEDRIREIYGELAVTTKDQGKDRLRALEIRPEDLREILGSRSSSTKMKLKKGGAPREAAEPAARPSSGSRPMPMASTPAPGSLPPASPAPPAGAPLIASPGGMPRTVLAGLSHRPLDDLARGTSEDTALAASSTSMSARPAMVSAATAAPQGTLPDLLAQVQQGPAEDDCDAPTTPSSARVYGARSGASAAMAGGHPDERGLDAPAKTLGRSPGMWGVAAIGVPALLIAAAIGFGLHALRLADERDQLAAELARPRPEDPALPRAIAELERIRKERDAAHQAIADLRAGSGTDASLQVCNTSLVEVKSKLGIAEGRASTLDASLTNSLRELNVTAKTKQEAEARATAVQQERDRLASEAADLKRTNLQITNDLSIKTGLIKALCNELQSTRGSKLLQICRGGK